VHPNIYDEVMMVLPYKCIYSCLTQFVNKNHDYADHSSSTIVYFTLRDVEFYLES